MLTEPRVHKDLDSVLELVDSTVDQILSGSGIADIKAIPSLMVVDWSCLGLRYAAPDWLNQVAREAPAPPTSAKGDSVPFAKTSNYSADALEQLLTRLQTQYARDADHAINKWLRFDFPYKKDLENIDELLSALIYEPPNASLTDVARMAIGLLPQPLEDGYAGYVVKQQKAIAHKVNDEGYPTYPKDLMPSRATRSIDYSFMKFLESKYFTIDGLHLVVAPITEGIMRLGVLIIFLFREDGADISPKELEAIARSSELKTIDSRLSLAISTTLSQGLGELVAYQVVSMFSAPGHFSLRTEIDRKAAGLLLGQYTKLVPMIFSGSFEQQLDDTWQLVSFAYIEHASSPHLSLIENNISQDLLNSNPNELLLDDLDIVNWELNSISSDSPSLRFWKNDSDVEIDFPLEFASTSIHQWKATIKWYQRYGMLHGHELACLTVRLNTNRVLWFCLPYDFETMRDAMLSVFRELRLSYLPYRRGGEFYRSGHLQLTYMLDHEVNQFFLRQNSALEAIYSELQDHFPEALEHYLSKLRLGKIPSAKMENTLQRAIASAEYARHIFQGMKLISNNMRNRLSDDLLAKKPLSELLPEIERSVLERLQAKSISKGRGKLSNVNIEFEIEDDLLGQKIESFPFRIVTENLIANAVEANITPTTDDGSGLIISEAKVEIEFDADTSQCSCKVINAGRLTNVNRGIGLLIVEEICEDLGWGFSHDTSMESDFVQATVLIPCDKTL